MKDILNKIKLEYNVLKIQLNLWYSENFDEPRTIGDYILLVLGFIVILLFSGVWAGCAIAMTLTGPLVFFPIFGIQLAICILAVLYYMYPEEIWRLQDEGKEYCRRRLCKLQKAFNVHDHS